MVPVHHGWLWFPNNPGLVSGIILGGFGFGSLIYDNVLTHMINPNNEPFDEETAQYPPDVNDRFIRTWRIMILTWFIIAVAGGALIFPGPLKK